MSIHFVSGKPGGGKSLYGVRLILDELVNGTRPIVTNVPLKLDALNSYLQLKYPDAFARRFSADMASSDFHQRHISEQVILMSEDELSKFFTFRGNGVRLETVTNSDWKNGVRPDFSKVTDRGVFYVLDEVHIAFNSRAWASTGHEVLYYLSQHRKLGDDVVCITQSIGNVDKQFRSVAQDFTYIKNLSKQKAGIFRLPGLFLRSTYTQPATENSKPSESGSFTLDSSGLASLYDTAKGVGIHGRSGADTSARKKGFHWLWFAIGFPLLIFSFIHFAPILLSRFFGHSSRPAASASSTNSLPAVAPIVSQASNKFKDRSAGFLSKRDTASQPFVFGDTPDDTNDVYCTGYSILSKDDVTVFFSDGTVAYSSDGEIQAIEKHWVKAFGRKYRIIQSVRYESPTVPVQTFANPVPPQFSVQQQYVESPVTEAYQGTVQILPSIHSQASAIPPTPRIGGFSSLTPQNQGRQQTSN